MTAPRAKVAHVITMLELGGAQQNTLYTVTHLDRSRFEPILVAGTEGPLVPEAKASGVRAYFLPSLVRPVDPAHDARAFVDLVRLLRRERPHVVHTHSSKAGILGRFAAATAGVPVIVHTIHGWGFQAGGGALSGRLFVGIERAAARATSAYVAVSRANLREGVDRHIFTEDRARVIRSGIALREFAPADGGGAGEAPWPAPPPGGAVVGMVACLKPQKAPLDFVAVAAEVLAREPATRFVLIGDGELRGEVEAAIAARGIGGAVTLAGWRRDVPDLMRRFDLLLHTSRWEGLPRVFPEAMATGIPIVATRVDGAPEAVENDVTGLLVEPGDVAGLAAGVVALLRDPERRRRMGRMGRDRVAEWDIDGMVRAQEALYEELLRAVRPPHV